MPFSLATPIVLTQAQTYVFSNLMITKTPRGLTASVTFTILDPTGKVVNSVMLKYTPSEFNAWWAAFNSGEFLYQQLATQNNLGTVPASVENDFVNS